MAVQFSLVVGVSQMERTTTARFKKQSTIRSHYVTMTMVFLIENNMLFSVEDYPSKSIIFVYSKQVIHG